MINLTDQVSVLSILPEAGGALVRWTIKDKNLDIFRTPSAEDIASLNPRFLSCFPLVPWSNRIDQGGFDTPSGWLALPKPQAPNKYPVHGTGWQQAWQVIKQQPHQLILRLETKDPFHFVAQQTISLQKGVLRLGLHVTHLGDLATWYGLGFHPYFNRTAETRLQIQATGVWKGEPKPFPTQVQAVPEHWSFAQERTLDSSLIDHAFEGWDGNCRIVQPDHGYVLTCQAQGAERFILYTPQDKNFFCVEPVTHPINAHHLRGRPGLALLHQGASQALNWILSYNELT